MHRPARIFADARSRRTVLVAVLVAILSLALVTVLFDRHTAWLSDPDAIREFVDGFGVLAPLAFVFLQALQVVIAPIPGQALGLASGWLFGAFWGTAYSLLGATIGSYVAFRLARHYGRPFVEHAIDTAVLDRFDNFSTTHGYLALFLVFLIPGLPDDVICFVGGTTDLDIKRMTAASLIGRIPGYFLTNLVGASIATRRYTEAATVVLLLVAVSLVVYLRRDALVAWLFPPTQ
ncbi:MAG: TVP38/TMEM64 family protein [Halapricum sp.]